MKKQEAIIQHFEKVKKVTFQPPKHDISDFMMERFSNFLNSYTKAFNKINKRKGALFMDYLKRSIVSLPEDFINFVWYIHKNAVHHRLTKAVGEWQYDSYRSLVSELPTALLRDEVIAWFDGKNAFIEFHQQPIDPKTDITDI
jgi:hypothetical protein